MNMIKTDKTYKTHTNAVKALDRALYNVNIKDREEIRYFIATKVVGGEVRFAPAVRYDADGKHAWAINQLVFLGITVFN